MAEQTWEEIAKEAREASAGIRPDGTGDWTPYPPLSDEESKVITDFLYQWVALKLFGGLPMSDEEKMAVGNFFYNWVSALVIGIIPISDLPEVPDTVEEKPISRGRVIVSGKNSEGEDITLYVRTGPGRGFTKTNPEFFLRRGDTVNVYEISSMANVWLRIAPLTESAKWVLGDWVELISE